jgi:hypothetical protein
LPQVPLNAAPRAADALGAAIAFALVRKLQQNTTAAIIAPR